MVIKFIKDMNYICGFCAICNIAARLIDSLKKMGTNIGRKMSDNLAWILLCRDVTKQVKVCASEQGNTKPVLFSCMEIVAPICESL